MSGDIVERLRYEAWVNPSQGETAEAHYLAADALDRIATLTEHNGELATNYVPLLDAYTAERALADQLADALRAVQHDRPTAHTDNVWAAINHALEIHEEARRER